MAQIRKFTVRPLPSRLVRNDNKDAFRILLSGGALVGLKLGPGEPCNLHTDDGSVRTAIAWNALERIQDSVVQTSTVLQDTYSLKLGDKVRISKFEGSLPGIDTVTLEEVNQLDQEESSGQDAMTDEDRPYWEWYLEHPLGNIVFLHLGMAFKNIDLKGQKRSFVISRIEAKPDTTTSSLFSFSATSKVSFEKHVDKAKLDSALTGSFELDGSNIGGLNDQVRIINTILEKYSSDTVPIVLPPFYRPSRGVLLYGPKGTGKSLLVEKISRCSWRKVFRISSDVYQRSDRDSLLRKTFSEAVQLQPSLLVLDDLDAIAGQRNASEYQGNTSHVSSLRAGFDTIKQAKVLVLAETRHPNTVDETLRASGRFATEVEIPVPTMDQRHEILKAIRGASKEPTERVLRELSEQTHGYVGADLYRLLQRGVEVAEERQRSSHGSRTATVNGPRQVQEAITDGLITMNPVALTITADDMTQALTFIRPSAMQEIFVETPRVRWSDIGGQQSSKRLLQSAVSRPLQQATAMSRLGLKPKKGIMLYGPPGCSKTLLVKALAAESGLNFLAVKGAEMVSMYVGESERNIREVFRKARAASPSIVFFDEVDAVAGNRSTLGNTGGSLNMLTTFLNEMDGFEELKNVLVVAATNRPDALDSALLRPGRFDNLIYVGLPSHEARQEILEIFFRESSVTEDVNATTLADLTQGYSGAEIVAICQTAGELTIDAAQNDDIAVDEISITSKHFLQAVQMTPKGITSDIEKQYQNWRKTAR
ncbi:MAG: hypothetical protein Q9160_006104 [Pyrenula sp. 1 TL-2023]